jgi:hypothetical protein
MPGSVPPPSQRARESFAHDLGLNFADKASETNAPIGGVTGGVTAAFCGAQVIVSRGAFESSERERFLRGDDDGKVRSRLAKGGERMPAQAHLSQPEVDTIL